jgi:hypothetical protein
MVTTSCTLRGWRTGWRSVNGAAPGVLAYNEQVHGWALGPVLPGRTAKCRSQSHVVELG